VPGRVSERVFCVCVCVCSVSSMCGYLSLRQELDVLGSLGLVLWDSAVHVWDLAIRKEAGMNAENKRCLGMSLRDMFVD